MKKLLGIILGLLLLTACQETLEQRCAREAKEYSQKNCPAPVGKDVTIDSLTFDMATHTLTYSYTVSGLIDDTTIINNNNPREQLLKSLKNATSMKPYRDAGYNFRYIYYSSKNKGTRLYEATFIKKDYISSSSSLSDNNSQKAIDIKDSVTWTIHTNMDEMTDSKNIWASIRSTNYIKQDFPYQGNTYATIIVRYMKKYGYDVLIEIDRGQIVGIDVSGTNYITARFDEGAPKNYYFDDATDGSTEHVFLRNSKDFMNRCKKAKDIKIEVPIFQSGRPVYKFHVDKPLIWPN